MRVSSSTYGSRGDVEPMVGVAVRLRALGSPLDDRFLSQGQVAQVAGFAWIPLDSATFPRGTTTGSG